MIKKDKKEKPTKKNEEEIIMQEDGCCESEANESDSICEKSIEELKSQLKETAKKADENLDGWQRSIAEFANFKKRMERDRLQNQIDSSSSIIKKVLPVLDDLDRALSNSPVDDNGAEWAKGIALVQRKLVTILENENVKPIDAENAIFNPNIHEAIAMEESETHESGQIIEVLQQGYMIGERVLRPTLVRVAS